MSDTTPTPTPAPATTRGPRGFISQSLEDDITLADDCGQEAAKPDIAAALDIREWSAADQALLTASLGVCTGYKARIKELRTGKLTRTAEEETARTAIVHALDPILKGARRTHASGSAERKAYGIGEAISSHSTQELLDLAAYAFGQLSAGPGGAAPKDKLKGVLPAEITALDTLRITYQGANWAQGDAETQAVALLALLKKEILEVLNPLRRDLQGTADQAYTHRDPLNAAQRTAFGLQADRPLVD
ncbi:MAG: hypothetical protein ABIT76_00325 [Chthoniobacterales bacterium]